MSSAREPRPFHQFPDPDYHDNLQRLEQDITELAAHINAANFQLLELVGIYDEQQGWGQHGLLRPLAGKLRRRTAEHRPQAPHHPAGDPPGLAAKR